MWDRRGDKPSIAAVFLGRAGGTPRKLLPGRVSTYPVWSPAGGRLAYVRAPGGLGTNGTLTLLRRPDSKQRRLQANVTADRLAWQPRP